MTERLEIEHSHFEAEDVMLNGDYLWQVVETLIGGVPTILEVLVMFGFMSLGRILLQGSISTNLFGPMRHRVDIQNIEVGIKLLVNISLVAGIIPPGVHLGPLQGWCPSVSIGFRVYLSLLHEFRSHSIGFGLCLFASLPK